MIDSVLDPNVLRTEVSWNMDEANFEKEADPRPPPPRRKTGRLETPQKEQSEQGKCGNQRYTKSGLNIPRNGT